MIEYVLSALQALLQVMVIVLAGVVFSHKGLIDNDKQKWLSKTNLLFFTPCLLFSSIAPVISFKSLKEFWPIPAFYLLFTVISWTICKITLPIFGIGKTYQRFVTACVLFCNANSLPIAIVSSVATSEAGKTLYWLPDDDQSRISARLVDKIHFDKHSALKFYLSKRGVSYTLFFGLFCNLLRWSLGYNMLQNKEDDEKGERVYSSSKKSSEVNREEEELENTSNIKQQSFVNETTSLLRKEVTAVKESKIVSLLSTLNQYMSPPLYAALLALFVGLCPPLKKVMFDHNAFVYNSLTNAIKTCGKASVPLVLFCLGAQLNSIKKSQTQSQTRHRLPVSLAVFLRMIVTPMVVVPLVYFFGKYGSKWSKLADDPMFLLSIIIVGCTPTSINLSQITQVSGAFEKEMLNVLFWSYGAVCIPVCTTVVFLALYLINSL